MRGNEQGQPGFFSYVSPEERVAQDHPLRIVRRMVNEALSEMAAGFDEMYARTGRPSIPPEQLLRAQILQILYSIRSERMLMEQLDYNLLFRWFVGLSMDDPIWHPTTFTKNRERLIDSEVATLFFEQIDKQAGRARLLSDEHFTVDGTLIEAWASLKSYREKDTNDDDPRSDGNDAADFCGKRLKNQTPESKTDPDARLYRRGPGKEAKLAYLGHVLMDNRHGLVVDSRVTRATGTAEREAAMQMLETIPGSRRITVGADKGYDTRSFVNELRYRSITPHVATKTVSSAIDRRTTRHAGYAASQIVRKRVEEIFGWMKTVGLSRKTRVRGVDRVGWSFTSTAAAYNLVRMRTLLSEGSRS